MLVTRLLTATALVALFAGPVAAQTTTNTPSSGQTADTEGSTPATDETTTTTQPATTAPPVAPGDTAMSQGQAGSTDQGTTTQGSTTQGSMGQGSTNAGGTMGTTASGNMNAGGTMGAEASGNMNAGGAMGSTAAGGGLMTSMNGNVRVTSNAPIPDTAENRARYGQPESGGGRSRIGEGPTNQLRRR